MTTSSSFLARVCRVAGRVADPALRPAAGSIVEVVRAGGGVREYTVRPDGFVGFYATPGRHTVRLIGPDGRETSAWAITVPARPKACLAALAAASIRENRNGD